MFKKDSKSTVKDDAAAKEKAQSDFKLIFGSTKGSGSVEDRLKKIKGPLIHTDSAEEEHCYLLELVRKAEDDISEKNKKYEEALAKNENTASAKLEISKNDLLLKELLQIHTALSVILLNSRAQEDEKETDWRRTSFRNSVEGILAARESEIRNRRSASGLQDVMCEQTTDATRNDKEYFYLTYNALEAKVRREKKATKKEKLKRLINRTGNMIQKEGVRTAIQVGGLVAIGVTSGGIGLGVALLTKVGAIAVSKGHEAFLEKYYKVPEEYKNYLDTSNGNAKLLKANVDSLATLKLKRDSASGEAKKILDLQIKAVEVAASSSEENADGLKALELERDNATGETKEILNSQIKAIKVAIQIKKVEEKVEKDAFTVLVDLISSRDPAKQEDATKFLDGFSQETRMLQAKGKKAFLNFRDNTQKVLDEAQQKSTEATLALNAVKSDKSKNSIDEKEYSDLMFNALEAQGAVNDILKPLDENYHQLLEVQRRDELYVKLAEALKEKASKAEADLTAADIKKGVAPQTQLGKKAKQAQQVVKDNKLSVQDTLVAAATTLASANEAVNNLGNAALYLVNNIRDSDLSTVIHNVEFQKRSLELVATISKETVSKLSAPLQANIMEAYNYVNENLSSVLLHGMSSAHLINDISPAGACTMLALLIYTSAHDKWYTKELKNNYLEITKLLNNRDISTLDDNELKKLQEMVGQTIHKFGNLLPKSMNDHLKSSKAIYEAELQRTKLFARATRFSDVVMYKGHLSTVSMNNPIFDKKKVYIAQDSKDANILIAYYYDGNKWDIKKQTNDEFKKQNFKISSKDNDVGEVEKITQFFDCKRTHLSKKKTEALEESKKNLDKMYKEVEQQQTEQQTEQQMVYCLTGLYRGIANQATTKNREETREASFELSRKRELMIILDKSAMESQEEREEAVPLIQEYVRNRKAIVDTLKDITQLNKDIDQLYKAGSSEADPSVLEQKLKSYEDASVNLGKPYEFLEGKNIDELRKVDEALRADNEEMSKKLATLVIRVKKEYRSNIETIIGKLEQIKQSGKADTSDLKKLTKYKADLEKLDEFLEEKSIDDLRKMGEALRTDNEEMSEKLDKLKNLNKKIPELSAQNDLLKKPELSRTQRLFTFLSRIRIFKPKPQTVPTTSVTASAEAPKRSAPLHASLETRLGVLSVGKKPEKQPLHVPVRFLSKFQKTDNKANNKAGNKAENDNALDKANQPTKVAPKVMPKPM
jgi:hypothetical protein